jgi:hypothetical protein
VRQYKIDELSREERANIESYLHRTLKPGPVDGAYWIEVPQDLLGQEQLAHKGCNPFFFGVVLEAEAVCFEMLVRSQANLHCSCIAYATAAQRDFVLRFVDKMLHEERIMA